MNPSAEQLMNYKKWALDERRVVAVINLPNGEAIEIDGQLKAVHERGIMIRPKGRITPEMANMDDVEKLELYDDIPKPIGEKSMQHIAFGVIRQHLADRHGFALEELNAREFTESKAYDVHVAEHAPGADKMSHFHEG